jgi:hypothetical protein
MNKGRKPAVGQRFKAQKNRTDVRLSTAYGNRTRDSSVKGMRLNRLTNAALTL